MKTQVIALTLMTGMFLSCQRESKQPIHAIYQYDGNLSTRWSSSENRNGVESHGAKENRGAKGHAFDPIPAHSFQTLVDIDGPGIITRMWITVADRSPQMLRSLKIEIFWDGEKRPAVSAPLGDFFGVGLGRAVAFQNEFFANPEGRSFNCFIPMPFKTHAKVVVTNEADKDLSHIFFDVDLLKVKEWNENNLYFHTYWNRDTATTIGKDFELLPFVKGKGKFLGVNVGINSNPLYKEAWWGEGEVKMFLDQDKDYPTIAGTGTEDYIGTGWGQGAYINNYSGCTIADAQKKQWAFYRYHIPDPVFFTSAIRVALQQIGGDMKTKVVELQKAGVPLLPVTIDSNGKLILLLEGEKPTPLSSSQLPDGWTNFYRSDDLSATAYFYLDTPVNNLPALQDVLIRKYKTEK